MSSTHLATALVAPFEHLRMTDVEAVGGKNASLGEMISQLGAVRRPRARAASRPRRTRFASSSPQGGLARAHRRRGSPTLDTDDVRALADAGAEIRGWIEAQPLPPALEAAIRARVRAAQRRRPRARSFAVRSSATAEDLPDASFAGQQETFLNIDGIDDVLAQDARGLRVSLYNDRAISYRVHKGYAHGDVALSAGVQRMVRSDLGAAGVMFTLDTETGFADVVFITSSYGLGETVVQGAVNPDEFYVHKPALQARQAGDHPPQPRLQADPDGVRVGRGARRERQAGDDRRHRDRAAQPLLAHRRRRRPSSPATRSSSSSTTAGRWTSSGARTASTASSTSCRRGPRR